jgi:hypothetical protein
LTQRSAPTGQRSREAEVWRRDEMRRLRADVEHLRAYRAKLERLLGIALQIAVAGTGTTTLALLDAIEELDRQQQEILARRERALEVLRDTDPHPRSYRPVRRRRAA